MKQFRAIGSSMPYGRNVGISLAVALCAFGVTSVVLAQDSEAGASTSGSLSLGGGKKAAGDAQADASADAAAPATETDATDEPVEEEPKAAPAEEVEPQAEPAEAVEPTPQPVTVTGVPAYAGARATHREFTQSERYRSVPYMRRYAPEGNQWEVGLFTGVLFPSKSHNLKVAVLPVDNYSPALQFGASLAYFPLSFLGAEIETWAAGGKLKDSGFSSLIYGVDAHAILQLPLASIVPFALVGGGALGGISEEMGHDRDPSFHFGGGLKVPMNHRVSGRLDVRDYMAQKRDEKNGKQTHNLAIQLGLTFTFERTAPILTHSDQDYDGLYDDEDKCPSVGALTVDGCPTDGDGDGVIDSEDQCPAEAGEAPSGCPNKDLDGDGVPVPADQCPDEAGPAPTGCPDRDEDGDGIIGEADQCPKAAEVRNGFQDDDGCPDEMPEDLKQFTGVIPGINFKQGTAQIEEASKKTLDSAAETLAKYPSIKIEVSGHTSSEGGDARNQELSEQRANAVRDYFVEKGISGERVIARGAGSSEPVADNATKEGRQQNRRIEFRVLQQ